MLLKDAVGITALYESPRGFRRHEVANHIRKGPEDMTRRLFGDHLVTMVVVELASMLLPGSKNGYGGTDQLKPADQEHERGLP